MNLVTFIKKSLTYIPRHIYYFWHNDYIKNITLKCMKNPEGVFYENILRKNLVGRLKYAYKNVPYYSQFNQLKDVNKENVFETLESLPLLSKDIIRQQKDKMYSNIINLEFCGKGSTGGTTGKPLTFYRSNPSTEVAHQMALYEYMTGIPYKHHLDKKNAIVAFDGVRPTEGNIENNIFWTFHKAGIYGSVDFCTLYMSESNLMYYFDELNKIHPLVIRGYSNAILKMAKYIKAHNLKLDQPPKGIYVTSEYCSKVSMQFISDAFNCNVFGQYGQTEACLFAWTKPNDDTYYCSPFYGYVEVLDHNGNNVKTGQLGEVVVTAFGGDVMPFIRYKTGDIVKCGNSIRSENFKTGIISLSALLGRKNEYIVDSCGQSIPLVGNIDIHYLNCKDKIIQYQIQQSQPGLIHFIIIKTNEWTQSDEDEITNLFKINNIKVIYEYVENIPLTKNGKQKAIIQNINRDN